MTMYHPWREFRSMSTWTLLSEVLPDGVWGATSWVDRTITLAPDLLQAERRSTLAHEIWHAQTGPAHPDPVLTAKDEAAADQAAARQLVDIHQLGEALAWSHGLDEAADELWVDRHTLDVRLATLAPCERRYLDGRLGEGPQVEPYSCPGECAERARLAGSYFPQPDPQADT